MSRPVLVVAHTDNTKTGRIAVTHASQATCPDSCPFRNSGCYAENGYQGSFVTSQLNKIKTTPTKCANMEAKGIRQLKGNVPLRLHIVGDCPNAKCANIVSAAAEEYSQKFNMPVWSDTHTRNIPRHIWRNISVLRSCHTVRQCEDTFKANYAASLAINKFKSHKKYYIGRKMYGIPCPAQTKENVTCKSCLLCTKDVFLKEHKLVVLFEAHGNQVKLAREKTETKLHHRNKAVS